MGEVKAVCISRKKGMPKEPVDSIRLIEDHGIEGDAHAGKWHRQVSLLSYEAIEEFKKRGIEIRDGAFGENIVVSGYDLKSLKPGTVFRIGDVLLELTQIGKECHSHCVIFHTVGDCIMPREGVFTKVLNGGIVKPGDRVEIVSSGA
ncbi:MAG: MOSC domain-containing protein [Clostridia bacterium]|nr:MOSC domain-containing protein [Clostridia bacterium]